MKRLAAICFALFWLGTVEAQSINNGSLSGRSVTASVAVSGAYGSTATIYTTPSNGQFVLTQVGASGGLDCTLLVEVTGFGPVATIHGSSSQRFVAGLVLPAGASIQCIQEEECHPSHCFVTGVLEIND